MAALEDEGSPENPENEEEMKDDIAKDTKTKSISSVLKDLAGTTEGLQGMGVMDMEGVPIAVVTPPGSSLNAELAAAQLAVVVRLCSLTADKLKLGGFDENLITTASKYILTRPLGANFYLAMILSKDSTTLGMVRMIAKEHADQIYEALPKF